MAFGYAYSILRDAQLAEDAAQEAFLEAYTGLLSLRSAGAFPAWFRKIVFKRCDRITRRRSLLSVPLAIASSVASEDGNPSTAVERSELRQKVSAALATLPPLQREVTMLFYIGDYSQREISEFLGVPISTIKNRLYAARKRLAPALIESVQDTLYNARPSASLSFLDSVRLACLADTEGNGFILIGVQDMVQTERH